jgi:hypothetical protein
MHALDGLHVSKYWGHVIMSWPIKRSLCSHHIENLACIDDSCADKVLQILSYCPPQSGPCQSQISTFHE